MFENLYKKNVNTFERQEIRRKKLLENQKVKRLEQQDLLRQTETNNNDRNGKSGYKKYKNAYMEKINLQFAEWLKEKPDNLGEWLLVPYPKGQRCLVIAEKGKTKMFIKNKRHRMTFLSLMPGGGVIGTNNDYCVLDCVYIKDMDVFYVLDALHFSIPLTDCEAEFRFFWLKSKFIELEGLEEKYKCEAVKTFHLLDNHEFSNEERLAMVLEKYPLWPFNRPRLDGFLFFHKKSHYIFGVTPLVCWLFPFMLPDILDIQVCSSYKPPPNYCKYNPWQYMNDFDKMSSNGKALDQHELVFNLIPMKENLEVMEEQFDESSNQSGSHLDDLLNAEKMLESEEGS